MRGATGYFGIYRGVVLNNTDPEKTGRLILQIPTVLGNRQSYWAMPSAPAGVPTANPEPGDHVWVMFEGGSTDAPVWIGVGQAEHLSPPLGVDISSVNGLQAALDAKVDNTDTRLLSNVTRVVHDGTAYAARPVGAPYVEWVGPTQPTAAVNGDTWVNTTTT